jgi:hypothetical protein
MLNPHGGTFKTTDGVDITIPGRSECHMHRIMVPMKKRGQRLCKKAVREFTKGVCMTLVPVPSGARAYLEDLIRFVRSFGFVITDGRIYFRTI